MPHPKRHRARRSRRARSSLTQRVLRISPSGWQPLRGVVGAATGRETVVRCQHQEQQAGGTRLPRVGIGSRVNTAQIVICKAQPVGSGSRQRREMSAKPLGTGAKPEPRDRRLRFFQGEKHERHSQHRPQPDGRLSHLLGSPRRSRPGRLQPKSFHPPGPACGCPESDTLRLLLKVLPRHQGGEESLTSPAACSGSP